MNDWKTDSQSTTFNLRNSNAIYSIQLSTQHLLFPSYLSRAATVILELNPNLFQPSGQQKKWPFLVGRVA